MKEITILGTTGLLKWIRVDFYKILDEVVDINNEIFQYKKKIKSKRRKRKGRKWLQKIN